MKLYYDPSSPACRAVTLFALDERIELDLRLVSLMEGENWNEAYGAINPNRTVPFLADGPLAIGECSAILKYLAEKTGSGCYPRDVFGRAQVNAAMDWFNTRFYCDFLHQHVYPQVLPAQKLPTGDLSGMIANGEQASARWLDVLDRHMLGGRPFVCGDAIMIADYLGAAFVTMGELVRFDLSKWPNVAAWLDRMKARPGWPAANAAFEGWVAARRFESVA